jgi:protein-L-isoaspartate O-methyltransferase
METALTYPELALHPRPLAGVAYPHPSLEGTYEPGVTEPWIQMLVSSLLTASGGSTVLETGGFRGITSAWLALTLERMGGGQLIVAEIDTLRARDIDTRLDALELKNTNHIVMPDDVMLVICALENQSLDLAWVDDAHDQPHVEAEICALWPKMKHGGIMAFHDVWGVCDLQRLVRKYGGCALNLPRLGPAGGIGILQVP